MVTTFHLKKNVENQQRSNKPVLRILAFLRRIRILGSGRWNMDPDPALFISGFQETNKKVFVASFLL
jgi:hypothetical protein